MNVTAIKADNGVNVEALLGARAALTEAPEAARFKWRATCNWVNGTHSHSTVEGFFGLRPPGFLVISATLHLPIERRRPSIEDARAILPDHVFRELYRRSS